MIGSKPFSVMLNKIAALIRDNDETKYYYRNSLKSSITYVDSHNYAKITIDSNDNLYLEKTLTMYIGAMLVKPFNKVTTNFIITLYKTFYRKMYQFSKK